MCDPSPSCFPDQLLHQVPTCLRLDFFFLGHIREARLLLLAPHDDTLEPPSATDRHARVESRRQDVPKVLKVKLGEKSKTAERKADDRRHLMLKQPTGKKHRPVPAQRDDEIEALGIPRTIHPAGYAPTTSVRIPRLESVRKGISASRCCRRGCLYRGWTLPRWLCSRLGMLATQLIDQALRVE